MQAAHPGIDRYIGRFMIVGGMLLALCLPIFWLTMQGQPRPMDHQENSHGIIWLYPLMISASQGPGTGILMSLIGVSGVLLAALRLLKQAPQGVRVFVVIITLILAPASMLYIDVRTGYHPTFQHRDSVAAHGKHYHLLEAKYPSGPSYEIVLACDALGVRCQQLLQVEGFLNEPVDLPAFVSQLPQT